MPTCYILCGMPGAGKTHIINELMNSTDFDGVVCSTDDVIDDIADNFGLMYDECFKDLIDFATKQYNRDVAMAISRGWDLILDQTNLTAKSRARKLAVVPKHYKKIVVVIPTHIIDPGRWQKQLYSRPGKTIPADVIGNMINTFEYPSFEEGIFDEIWTQTIDADGNQFLSKQVA